MLFDEKNLVDRLIMLRQCTYAATNKYVAFLQVCQKRRCIGDAANLLI